ncbi:MAG: hypothetical protein WC760_14480 [Bacteroidia bacterium]
MLRRIVVAELGADAVDAAVDRTVERLVVEAAHAAQDLAARQRAAGVAGQQPQHLELAFGQRHDGAVVRDAAFAAQQVQAAELQLVFERRGVGRQGCSTPARPQPRRHHRCRPVGVQHVVGAHLQRQHLVELTQAVAGHQQRPRSRQPAQLAQAAELPGQVAGEPHQHGFERIVPAAVDHRLDHQAFRGQQALQRRQHRGVVGSQEQHAHGGRWSGSRAPTARAILATTTQPMRVEWPVRRARNGPCGGRFACAPSAA